MLSKVLMNMQFLPKVFSFSISKSWNESHIIMINSNGLSMEFCVNSKVISNHELTCHLVLLFKYEYDNLKEGELTL